MNIIRSLAVLLIGFGAVAAPDSARADSCGGSSRRYQGDHHVFGWSAHEPFERGIMTGSLTRSEVRNLREDQQDIRRKQRQYYADGKLTRWERADLWDEVSDYRRDLNHDLHDRDRRW